VLLGGAMLAAALAILTEVLFAGLERVVTPRTRTRGTRSTRGPVPTSRAAASA